MNEAVSKPEKPPKKRKALRWRFSIRTALILMTIVAFAMMYYQRRARAIEAVREIQEMGATVDFHPDSMPFLNEYTDDFFLYVSTIDFQEKSVSNDDLEKLKDIPYLQVLSVSSLTIDNEGFKHISKCKELRELLVSGCGRLDDSCVDSIKQLTKLERLDVSYTNLPSTETVTLANLETLRHLTFSCTGRSQSLAIVPHWYSAKTIKSISDRSGLDVVMVDEAYLENVDDQTVPCLEKMDAISMREIHVRNSDLSLERVNAVRNLGDRCRRIRFKDCPLQPAYLQDFDVQKTSLVLQGTTLKVTDLINLFGSKFLSAKFGSSETEFITAPQTTLRIDSLADQLEVDCFEQMPNLTHVDCFCRKNQSFLKAIEQSQPSISLYAHLRTEDSNVTFWDTIKATPSLTSLAVRQPPREICPQFTTEHQLRRLDLLQVPDDPAVINENLFQEIAKLKALNTLTIRNKLTVGKEISPLQAMKKLKRVEIGSLNDDAANLLLRMNLDKLNVSLDHLSPATSKQIRRAR